MQKAGILILVILILFVFTTSASAAKIRIIDVIHLTDGSKITGLTSAAIDTVAGMSNNYVLTATGASAITGESNLQFDGTGLAVTGAVTASYFKGDGSALTNVEDPNAVVFSIVFGG